MADFSESDYGEEYYGDGFYSYVPVWLFEGQASVEVSVNSEFMIFGNRLLAANVNIDIAGYSNNYMVIRILKSDTVVRVTNGSINYIGPFWNPDQQPINPGQGIWVPSNVDVYPGPWQEYTKSYGPWDPWGPDMRPNYNG